MLEIYEKEKKGKPIRVLAINNRLARLEYFPMVDIDNIIWNKLKWMIFDAVDELGTAITTKTGNGFHIYFPHTTLPHIATVRVLNKYFGSIVEKEYHDIAYNRGYHSLRVSRYGNNCVRLYKRIDGKETIYGKQLEIFIREIILMYGEVQI